MPAGLGSPAYFSGGAELNGMNDVGRVSSALRQLVLQRWSGGDIIDHVSVALPAPIFEKVSMELRVELRGMGGGSTMLGDGSLVFGGIRYTKVRGVWWQIENISQKDIPKISGNNSRATRDDT